MGDSFELVIIDEPRWGEMRTAEGWCIPLVTLISMQMSWERLPAVAALRAVVSMLRTLEPPRLYITRRNDFARCIDDDSGWPNSSTHGRGPLAFLDYVENSWSRSLRSRSLSDRLTVVNGGQPCVDNDQANQLFPDQFDWLRASCPRDSREELRGGWVRWAVDETADPQDMGQCDREQLKKRAVALMFSDRYRGTRGAAPAVARALGMSGKNPQRMIHKWVKAHEEETGQPWDARAPVSLQNFKWRA